MSVPDPAPEAPATLVTGATGFLGRQVVAQLVAKIETEGVSRVVHAVARHGSLRLQNQGVTMVTGSVCDPRTIDTALQGVDEVYHLAGMVSRNPDDAARMYRLHVEGTRELLRGAAALGVRRVVVVSTSGTRAVSRHPDVVSDETSPYAHAVVARWPYYLSKIYQEQLALEMGRELGVEVVVVAPSLILGPGDERGSSTTDITRVVRGRLPVCPRGGGVAFVDVRDAAQGCLSAMARGRSGESYLLSAANMPLENFLGRVARLAQMPAPRPIRAPRSMSWVGGMVESVCRTLDVPTPIDRQSIEMAEHTWYVNAAKAKQDLGFTYRDPHVTLAETVRDVQGRSGRGRPTAGASAALL